MRTQPNCCVAAAVARDAAAAASGTYGTMITIDATSVYCMVWYQVWYNKKPELPLLRSNDDCLVRFVPNLSWFLTVYNCRCCDPLMATWYGLFLIYYDFFFSENIMISDNLLWFLISRAVSWLDFTAGSRSTWYCNVVFYVNSARLRTLIPINAPIRCKDAELR